MKQKTRAILKDKILSSLYDANNHLSNTKDLSQSFKVDHFIILNLGQELFLEEFVIKVVASSVTPEGTEYVLKILPKGVFFLKEEGGFINRFKIARRKRIWTFFKTPAAVLNASAIIIISIWATHSSNESKKLKQDLMKKDSIIQMLLLKQNPPIKDSIK